MKRNKPDLHIDLNPNDVKPHWSWFAWYDCKACEQQFRREKGWTWKEYRALWAIDYFICSACAATVKDCNNWIDGITQTERERRRDWINHNKLNPPPQPPPMRKG